MRANKRDKIDHHQSCIYALLIWTAQMQTNLFSLIAVWIIVVVISWFVQVEQQANKQTKKKRRKKNLLNCAMFCRRGSPGKIFCKIKKKNMESFKQTNGIQEFWIELEKQWFVWGFSSQFLLEFIYFYALFHYSSHGRFMVGIASILFCGCSKFAWRKY
jgi:hypothetical protein